MPVSVSKDGRKVEHDTVHVHGGCCVGVVAVLLLAFVGAWYLIAGTLGLLLGAT
jgi:hypothetical protein